jgi:hypothetical protein
MREFLLASVTALSVMTASAVAEPIVTTMASPDAGPGDTAGADGQRCVEWPAAIVAAQMNNPDASLVKVMEGTLADEFIKVVNALPPASEFAGNHVALFFNGSDEQFLVVIGKDACASHVVQLPAALIARMVGQPV